MNKPKVCKGCPHLHPYYGNKNKQGKRTVSRYWCAEINGTPSAGLKECKYREADRG